VEPDKPFFYHPPGRSLAVGHSPSHLASSLILKLHTSLSDGVPLSFFPCVVLFSFPTLSSFLVLIYFDPSFSCPVVIPPKEISGKYSFFLLPNEPVFSCVLVFFRQRGSSPFSASPIFAIEHESRDDHRKRDPRPFSLRKRLLSST